MDDWNKTKEQLLEEVQILRQELAELRSAGLAGEEWFRQIAIDDLSANIAVLDETGRIIRVNRAWCEFADANGFHLDHYGVGCQYLDVFPDSDDAALTCIKRGLEQLLSGEQTTFYQDYACHSPSVKRWFRIRGSSRQQNDQRLILLSHEDITSHVLSEISARDNENLLRLMCENYPNAYVSIIESDYTVSYSGGQAFKKHHIDPRQFNGLALDTIFGDLAPIVRERYSATFRGEEQRFELFINNQHQLYRTVPIVDENDRVNRILAVVEDITDRKHPEALLAARNRINEFALTQSTDEMLRVSLDEVEEMTGSQIAFLHFLDEDQESLSLQMWSSNTLNGMCRHPAEQQHYPLHQAGVWVDCVRERRPVIHNDYASLPHKKGMPAGHAEVIRELVVPVIRDHKIKAVFGVGNKPVDYTETDVETVSILADLVWDIVDRKLSTKALEENEQKFRSIAEQMTDMIYITDRNGVIRYLSPASTHIFGFQPAEMYGHQFTEYLAEESLPLALAKFHDSLEKHIPATNLQMKMKRKDGSVFWGELNGNFYQQAGMEGTIGVIRDITDQKNTADKIRRSEARLNRGERVARSGNWEFYLDQNQVIASAGARLLYGFGRDEPLTIFEVKQVPLPEYRPLMDAALQKLVEEGQPYDIEFQIQRVDNGVIMDIHSVAEYDPKRRVVFGIIHDITARKRVEKSLTEALAEKTALLRELYHRTRNNMQIIAAMLSLAAAEATEEKIRLTFKDMESRIEAMAMVHLKLYQSKNLSRIDLADYITDLIYHLFMAYEHMAKSVEPVLNLTPVSLLIDSAVPLGLLLTEIITNSLKHAFPDGAKGQLSVSLERLDDESICLTASDNGIGFPNGFDTNASSALGLKYINLLAEQLQAKLKIETERGVGYRLRFRDDLYKERV